MVQQSAAQEACVEALQAAESKQRTTIQELRNVERQIYDLESRYLETANPQGNALKGYEGFLTLSGTSGRRAQIKPEDRLFSMSSVTGGPRGPA
ncbi:hypothetical protein WJX72_009735 [[Myrmecia] bisecta]|uniref:Chromatin modification-related protein MEAF6 n=1 Tax=[Myrmecia] bisecta TaxID=41462 RepID=A0AAW1P8J5_9CHLO